MRDIRRDGDVGSKAATDTGRTREWVQQEEALVALDSADTRGIGKREEDDGSSIHEKEGGT